MTSMIQRECAACGKLFQPKGRERYCSGPHYKPCPVCGEQVLTIYWSDPPKRCDKCRKANAKPVKPIFTPPQMDEKKGTISTDDNITLTVDLGDDSTARKYIGPENKSIPFKKGHSYILKAEKEDKYGSYVVTSNYDATTGEDINFCIRYSSLISIDQHFAK